MRIVVLSLLIIFLAACQRESSPYGGVKEGKGSSPEYTYTPDINRKGEPPK